MAEKNTHKLKESARSGNIQVRMKRCEA